MNCPDATLAQIGAQHGVSASRVAGIKQRAGLCRKRVTNRVLRLKLSPQTWTLLRERRGKYRNGEYITKLIEEAT